MYDWKFLQNRDQWVVDMITIHRFLSHQWLENLNWGWLKKFALGMNFTIIGSFGTYDSYNLMVVLQCTTKKKTHIIIVFDSLADGCIFVKGVVQLWRALGEVPFVVLHGLEVVSDKGCQGLSNGFWYLKRMDLDYKMSYDTKILYHILLLYSYFYGMKRP